MSNDYAQMPKGNTHGNSWRKQQKEAIFERRTEVRRLYLKERLSMEQIAERLGISLSTVSEDFSAITAEWRRDNQADISAHVARELEKIDADEKQAQDAYERSRKTKRVATVTKRSSAMGEETAASATQIERDEGDPRFLALKAKYRDQRMKLLSIGMDDDEQKKTTATNFAEYVALHLKERESRMINVTPRKELSEKGSPG